MGIIENAERAAFGVAIDNVIKNIKNQLMIII